MAHAMQAQRRGAPMLETAVQPRRLLALAEDDDDARAALERAFEDAGFEVESFEDGYELFDYFSTQHRRWPSVIVSDVSMPGCSGLEALKTARAHGVRIPVIVITAQPEAEVAPQVAELGNARLLLKPLDLEELMRAASELSAGA